MNSLQMLVEVPQWARKRGLDEVLFDLLEDITRYPELKDQILSSVEYGERCCLQSALQYVEAKGLIINEVVI